MLTRIIPSTGEAIPAIGLGTWQTFDVHQSGYHHLKEVLTTMHLAGSTLIDCSPMYGKAEKVIGDITSTMPFDNDFFYATKVWTTGLNEGIAQMESSMRKMQRQTIDLIQIHNLVDWKTHLKTLRNWKEEGKIRHIGITHYTDAYHEELEKIMTTEKIDFVQFNYSITARHAEKRLLDAASSLGVATLINRPFGEGKLFSMVQGKSLPAWAAENGMHNWADFFLKFILAHPAVTCVIPATGKVAHLKDNLKAGEQPLPDEPLKKRMVQLVEGL